MASQVSVDMCCIHDNISLCSISLWLSETWECTNSTQYGNPVRRNIGIIATKLMPNLLFHLRDWAYKESWRPRTAEVLKLKEKERGGVWFFHAKYGHCLCLPLQASWVNNLKTANWELYWCSNETPCIVFIASTWQVFEHHPQEMVERIRWGCWYRNCACYFYTCTYVVHIIWTYRTVFTMLEKSMWILKVTGNSFILILMRQEKHLY